MNILKIIEKPAMNMYRAMSKNSPKILLATGLVGIPVTVVMAVRATPKAIQILEKEEQQKNKKLTTMETVQSTWKLYIPSVITGSLSIACILASSSINAKRYAALGSLYSLSETALKEYQDKILETQGEKKLTAIRDEIAQDRVNANPSSNNQIIMTGMGDTLCYDALSGRYFKSNIEKIRKVENDLNHSLISSMYISLNEVYWALGLEGIGLGDEMGWNIDNKIDFAFSSTLDENGIPCLVLDYIVGPKHDYR